MQHRTETKIEPNGTIILRGLPFPEGDKVTVVITTRSSKIAQTTSYPLRGLPVEYKNQWQKMTGRLWRDCRWLPKSNLEEISS